MTDYNDLWELDRGDYVNIITELRAELDLQKRRIVAAQNDNREQAAELEQAKADAERWAGSSGFYSDSLAMANESAKVLQAERDKYAAALVEIRGICTAMMDGWGQTVTVLDSIRKITLAAIKRQPTEPPHRPETFA